MTELALPSTHLPIAVAAANNAVAPDSLVLYLLGMVAIIIIVFLAAAVVVLVRKEHIVLTPDQAKDAILQAEQRAQTIIADAAAEARQARLTVEKERMKALNEDHKEVERFLDAYRFHLEKTIKDLGYGIEKEHMRATSHFVEQLQNIEQRVALNADEAKHSMDSFTTQSGTLFDRLAFEIENVEKGIQHLASALEEAAANESDKNAETVRAEMRKIGEQTAQSVLKVAQGLDEALRLKLEDEFKSISDELDHYREARMRLVDEHILTLIEETAQIALHKQLSMQDQADLVYRSLEEAKQRGIFV